MPDPTWANHLSMAKDAGLALATYRYYDKKTLGLDFAGMCEDIKVLPRTAPPRARLSACPAAAAASPRPAPGTAHGGARRG